MADLEGEFDTLEGRLSALEEGSGPGNNGSSHEIVQDGLVLWLQMDEGNGSVAYDGSGHENHGSVHGASWVTIGDGYALQFDGIDDYIDGGNDDSLELPDERTVEMWLNYTGSLPFGDYYGVLRKPGKGDYGFFCTRNRSSVNFITNDGSDHTLKVGDIEADTWYHMVGSLDSAGTMQVYVNSTLSNTGSGSSIGNGRGHQPGGIDGNGYRTGSLQHRLNDKVKNTGGEPWQ